MYTDFYVRTQDDPNFIPDVLASNNELENLVTQIRMTLLTTENEVLGMPDFGFSAFKYLFNSNYVNVDTVAAAAKQQIDTYCTLAPTHNVETEANVYEIEKFRDALGLDVTIDGRGSFGVLLD